MKKLLSVLFACCTAFGVTAAPDDTAVANRKWVREALYEYAAKNAAQDDELHCDGTNCWIYIPKEANGTITNVPYYLNFSISTTNGDLYGAIVVKSDNPNVPSGTLLAKVGYDKYVNATKNLTVEEGDLGPLLEFNIIQNPEYDINTGTNLFTNISFENSVEITKDGSTARRVVTSTKEHTSSYAHITETITSSGRTTVYHYTIKGLLIFQDEFDTLCRGIKNPSPGKEDFWCIRSNEKQTRQSIILSPRDGYTLQAAPFSILSLFIPSAYAQEQVVEIVSPLPLRSFPCVDFVDTFTYAPEDVTSETHWPLPDKLAPSREQWYDPLRWFQAFPNSPFPMAININVYEDGVLIQKNRKTRINSVETLLNLGATIVQYDWPGVDFEEKIKMCSRGHIFGENCVCIVCEVATREHNFELSDVFGNDACARCIHEYDDWDENKWGEKIPNGKKKKYLYCGANLDIPDLDLHRGWNAVKHPDDEYYYCDCECGYYHNAEPLKHIAAFDPEEDVMYTDCGDGIHHKTEKDCARKCGAKITFEEEHNLDINAELPPEIVRECIPHPDPLLYSEIHRIDAICTAKGCGYIGKLQERHHFDRFPCYCELCELTIHKYERFPCGPYDNLYCSREDCNAKPEEDPENPSKHYYIAGTDPDVHYCECGREKEAHSWTLRGNNYYCTICDQMKENDFKSHRKCRYKSNDNEDETHTESPKGVSPDDPDQSTGTSCTYCKRQVISDIPEWKRELIRTNFKDLPENFDVFSEFNNLPWCWYSIALKMEGNNDTFEHFYCYSSEENAGLGTKFGFIAEAANSWVAPMVTLSKHNELTSWGLISLHYPYDFSNKDKANCANFTLGCLIAPKTDLEYDKIEYLFEIKKDENSGEYNLFWD